MTATQKPKLSFWQIWNMSFGFLGIQFGFALQGGFMSRIFQTLGASQDSIPALWIAAPLTGLLVQPIIGYMSDRTWSPRWGRRKPFFFIGAILSTIVLFFMPHSPVLWVAAGCLWILDASINITMEPFRALVADKLPDSQRSYGFVMQTLIIGIGTWVASNLPWLVTQMGVSNEAQPGLIPLSVKIAFAIGGVVFLASVLYTIFTTTEYPPEDLDAFKKENEANKGFFKGFNEIISSIGAMPKTMKLLGIIQFFSWFAFFAMWSLATPALTTHVFHSPAPVESTFNMADENSKALFMVASKAYNDAADLVGSYMGMYGLSSMAFALLLTLYAAKRSINRKYIHMLSLIAGGLGFISMYYIQEPSQLMYSFILIGISWGSILSMPYAMLSSAINPNKMGVYMGIFNMFIVIPQIIAATGGLNYLYHIIFGADVINAMLLAGSSLIVAGLANFLITDKNVITQTES
ncbi:MAG: MFS transporter [Sphingobacteriales bacterium]|nr:MFS transporter [Sphingobacteriales bacterium]